MKPFASLLKREWLEHKTPFVWVPLIVSVLILIFTLVAYNATGSVVINTSQESSEVIDGVLHVTKEKRAVSLSEVLAGDGVQAGSADVRDYFYIPLVLILLLGLLNSTLDERKDGSILFFKSMPVSDATTVASKYCFMLWIAPLVTVGCILLLQLMLATWSSFNPHAWPTFAGQGLGGFVNYTTNTLVCYVLYGLWAMAPCAWVLLVGAWARRGALLWVIGLPLALSIIESVLNGTQHFQDALFRHLSPKLEVNLNSHTAGSDVLSQVITMDFWLGLAIGLVLLALTIYCRRTHNEI